MANERLAHLVKDATRALVRALQVRLARHAVPFGHWAFLRILWEHDGITQRQLSNEAGVMEPTTASALRTMQRLGYVTRRQHAENRKNVYVYLTPKGRALKEKLVPLAEQVNGIAVRGARAEDVAATRRLLITMLENLSRDEALRQAASSKASPAARAPRREPASARQRPQPDR